MIILFVWSRNRNAFVLTIVQLIDVSKHFYCNWDFSQSCIYVDECAFKCMSQEIGLENCLGGISRYSSIAQTKHLPYPHVYIWDIFSSTPNIRIKGLLLFSLFYNAKRSKFLKALKFFETYIGLRYLILRYLRVKRVPI